jgi:hypothetical protein
VSVDLKLVGDDLYTGEATRPGGVQWATTQPMSSRDIIRALEDLGFHGRDVMQAFYDADPARQSQSS